MNRKGNSEIVIIAVIILVILLFFIRVPFESFSAKGELRCEDGEAYVLGGGLLGELDAQVKGMSYALECNLLAGENARTSYSAKCINEEPIIICKTQLYRAILLGKIDFSVMGSSKGMQEVNEEPEITNCNTDLNFCKETYNKISLQDSVSEHWGFLMDTPSGIPLETNNISISSNYVADCNCEVNFEFSELLQTPRGDGWYDGNSEAKLVKKEIIHKGNIIESSE